MKAKLLVAATIATLARVALPCDSSICALVTRDLTGLMPKRRQRHR